MPTKKKSARLGRATWDSPTASATLIVGQNKGKLAPNRKGFCALRPAKFSTAEVEKTVRSLREMQLQDQNPTASRADIKRMYSATSVHQKGWYHGDPEKSVAIVFHSEGTPDAAFKASMRHLADRVSSVLCQDEVLISFDTPSGRGAEGRSTSIDPTREDLEERENAQRAVSQRRRR
jgi:hypothetical protein